MGFWLDTVLKRSRIPYSVFFTLLTIFIYLLGIPFMIATGNLSLFFSEPRWVFLALAGATSSIPTLLVYRKFLNSLDRIKYLFVSEDEFQRMKDKLEGYLTKKAYLLISAFWLTINLLNFTGAGIGWFSWWWFNNQP